LVIGYSWLFFSPCLRPNTQALYRKQLVGLI